ncbi:MAG: hypothetical protein JWQ48_639 [Conexibacter sp.]|nr:hypothetical protein [Conexibacter sp.]
MSTSVTARRRAASRSLAALGAVGLLLALSGCGVATVGTPDLGRLNATSSAKNLIAAQSRKPYSGTIYRTGGWLAFTTDAGVKPFAFTHATGADGAMQRQLLSIQQSGQPDAAALARSIQAAATADHSRDYAQIAAAVTQLSGG